MFVITADQIGSRSDIDRAEPLRRTLERRHTAHLLLPIDQTAGDELQAITSHAPTALALILEIARTGRWSIGLGVGSVRTPLPEAVRKASGAAFVAAREAVTRAKKSDTRFAMDAQDAASAPLHARELEPLIDMLLLLRARRSERGWEAVELLEQGLAQNEIARRLQITESAVSQRLAAAQWRVEEAASPALIRLLDKLDRASTTIATGKENSPS